MGQSSLEGGTRGVLGTGPSPGDLQVDSTPLCSACLWLAPSFPAQSPLPWSHTRLLCPLDPGRLQSGQHRPPAPLATALPVSPRLAADCCWPQDPCC